jgi:antitoxin HicB
MASKKGRVGSDFDEFLAEEGLLEHSTAVAIKRMITWQLQQAMKAQAITKRTMAERMGTSRSSLDRLLDEDDTGLTLDTLTRAAQAVGRQVRIELAGAPRRRRAAART